MFTFIFRIRRTWSKLTPFESIASATNYWALIPSQLIITVYYSSNKLYAVLIPISSNKPKICVFFPYCHCKSTSNIVLYNIPSTLIVTSAIHQSYCFSNLNVVFAGFFSLNVNSFYRERKLESKTAIENGAFLYESAIWWLSVTLCMRRRRIVQEFELFKQLSWYWSECLGMKMLKGVKKLKNSL